MSALGLRRPTRRAERAEEGTLRMGAVPPWVGIVAVSILALT